MRHLGRGQRRRAVAGRRRAELVLVLALALTGSSLAVLVLALLVLALVGLRRRLVGLGALPPFRRVLLPLLARGALIALFASSLALLAASRFWRFSRACCAVGARTSAGASARTLSLSSGAARAPVLSRSRCAVGEGPSAGTLSSLLASSALPALLPEPASPLSCSLARAPVLGPALASSARSALVDACVVASASAGASADTGEGMAAAAGAAGAALAAANALGARLLRIVRARTHRHRPLPAVLLPLSLA